MTNCNCKKISDILDYASLKKRFKETKSILTGLDIVAGHPEKEHQLLRCGTCGQCWQRSLSWTDGNKSYVFKVVDIEVEEWERRPFVQPDELLVRSGVIRQYLERGVFEEQPGICKQAGCTNYRIKLSVFCIIHQMENVGVKLTSKEGYTWFTPYEKEMFEPTYQWLREMPNYKKLK